MSSTKSYPFTASGNAVVGTNTVTFSGSGVLSQDGLKAATFEGRPALQKTSSMTGTITGNGVTVPINGTSTTYIDSNYVPLGDVTSSGYAVVSNASSIPDTGTLGSTGVWYTEKLYRSSAKVSILGTMTVSYVIEPDVNPDTSILKIIQVITDNTGQVINGSVSYRMAPSGSLVRISEIGYVPSANLTISISY
ncbi:MAG: hypothetical protein IPN53_21765 [Comamonadaceae bacterium]|nr:hypothetical protein [Comamonadaceae bacterium]